MSAENRQLNIYNLTIDGANALGFDSGLDARSFAQARFAQFLTEPGHIVDSRGAISPWKAGGVIEAVNPSCPDSLPTMHIWGPSLTGSAAAGSANKAETRLDLLLNDASRQDEALAALVRWIDGLLALETQTPAAKAPLWPCAALTANTGVNTSAAGTIFFMPENIVRRCMQAEGTQARLSGADQYVHPDLQGREAMAFTAGAMLYRIFSGTGAFTSGDEETMRQDMREGNFLPIRLAAPGLDPALASLIQQALSPNEEKKNSAVASLSGHSMKKKSLPGSIREKLKSAEPDLRVEKFFVELGRQEKLQLGEEKEKYQHRKKITVNTRRFITRNNAIILGVGIALLAVSAIGISIVRGRINAPNTAGMDALTVVSAYYEALNTLDHQFMEACTAKGAGKNDINLATNLFVITKVRQAYESTYSQFTAPDDWLEAGSPESDTPVFGISGLNITHISGGEYSETAAFSASYTLWLPMNEENPKVPAIYNHTDELRLERIKGRWRITEIARD